MPIFAEPIFDKRFESLNEVASWTEESSSAFQRLPIDGLIENHSVFLDDEYFGIGDTLLRFNDRGIRGFCSAIGFRFDQLKKLEKPSLATDVINDLIGQSDVRQRLADQHFVLDETKNTIIGVVSESYVTYQNVNFLKDIQSYLNQEQELFPGDGFEFREAYAVNTELTLRFCSHHHHGTVRGRGGSGEDKTIIGLEFANSMEGGKSLRVNYFLHRLVCSNGMMVPAAESINRINHSGKRETFEFRLKSRFDEVIRKIDHVKEMIYDLGDIRFDPTMFARNRGLAKRVFGVVPATKQLIAKQKGIDLQKPKHLNAEERKKAQIEIDSRILELIPDCFGGEDSAKVFQSNWRDSATAFDLVNVFTEYAKGAETSRERLEIEQKAGELAKYISDNKKKL